MPNIDLVAKKSQYLTQGLLCWFSCTAMFSAYCAVLVPNWYSVQGCIDSICRTNTCIIPTWYLYEYQNWFCKPWVNSTRWSDNVVIVLFREILVVVRPIISNRVPRVPPLVKWHTLQPTKFSLLLKQGVMWNFSNKICLFTTVK